MRIKFHIVAGLVTIAVAIALFFVMGGMIKRPAETMLASADPEFMQVPAGPVGSDDSLAQPGTILEQQVLDLLVDDTGLWIATPVGLLRADRDGRVTELIDSADGLDPSTITAITPLGDRLLYCTDQAIFESDAPRVFRRSELPLAPPIVAAATSDSTVVVGSFTDGVFAMTANETIPLKTNLAVTAIVQAPEGIWVGTNGDGLWLYNGAAWQQRFLRNDTAAFDWITALAYRWPHLWVGTTDGVYRYDGGRWDTYTTSDSGYAGGWVTDLAFVGTRLYIGTANRGLWMHDGAGFSAVPQLLDGGITCVRVHHRDVYVGTQNSGVFLLRSGKWRALWPARDVLDSLPQQWTLL